MSKHLKAAEQLASPPSTDSLPAWLPASLRQKCTDDAVITVALLAEALELPLSTAYRLADRCEPIKIGRVVRVSARAVVDHLEAERIRLAPVVAAS
jgi:hypothetical protein